MSDLSFPVSDGAPVSGHDVDMLCIKGGVPAAAALGRASNLLAAVLDTIAGEAGKSDTNVLWGSVALLDIVKGIVDAAATALPAEEVAHS